MNEPSILTKCYHLLQPSNGCISAPADHHNAHCEFLTQYSSPSLHINTISQDCRSLKYAILFEGFSPSFSAARASKTLRALLLRNRCSQLQAQIRFISNVPHLQCSKPNDCLIKKRKFSTDLTKPVLCPGESCRCRRNWGVALDAGPNSV